MDTNLLRSWLGLPPGPWPPPDRELLDLPSGPVVPADAERKVLERMARLRPHQLVHPDLVTEGMNRVAQALLAVTSSTATPEEPAVAAQPMSDRGLEVDLQAVVIDAPVVPPAEVVEAEVVVTAAATSAVKPRRIVADRPPPPPPAQKVPPEFADLPAISLPVPDLAPGAEARRDAYRELAGLRTLRRALDRIRPYIGNRNETASNPGRVLGLVESTLDLRSALRHPGLRSGRIEDRAPSLVGVVCEPLALAVFRSLVGPQRALLAREWAAERAWVEAAIMSLQSALRSSPDRGRRGRSGRFWRGAVERPEWLLAALTILVLASSTVRVFL